ncbi:hypothetical protein MPSEU_000367100 [Mayamaea pseudoterrestris]|nr:hypothetical protein MPSEU_000367100 [Mayamaea pseudoterrestris]
MERKSGTSVPLFARQSVRNDERSRLRDESTVTNDKGIEVKQVPLKLWAHSVHTAVVLDNLLARGKYSNAYAAFKEHPLVRSTDLVPWGNQGWMKKPGKQKHFVSKAELVYFVGYADLHSSDTFLVWKPSTGQVIVTRNVKFAHPDHQQRIVNEGTTSDSDSDRSSDGHKEDSSDGDSLPQDAPPESSDDESVIQSGRDTAPRVNHLPLPLPPVNSRLQRELRRLDSDYNPSSVEEERRTRASVRQSEPVERDTVPSPIPTVPQVASVAAIATSKAKRPPLPTNAKEAYLKENKLVWGPATFEEYDKFMKREAWVVEDRPKDRKLLRMKNVFTYKENAITRIYEARCRNVILGYNMREGIDYNESFSPTPVDQTIRTHLTVSLFIRQEIEDRDGPEAAEANWRCCDVFDIDAAFLNTPVATDLWIEAPPLFEEYCKSRGIPFDPTKQCLRLANTQYGQVDASALWLKHFAKILHAAGMTRMKSDPCMFFKRSPDGTLLLLVTIYVDDAAVSGVPREVEELKRKVKEYVDIKDLGPIRKHLGIHYKLLRDKVGVYYECTMTTYKNDIISEFKRYTNQTTLKDVQTPAPGGSSLLKNEGEPIDSTGYRSFKGKVLFGDRKVWPDISNAVRDGCSHVNNPSEEAWKQLTRIMSYLEHHEQPLKLRTPNSLQSFAISDTDWATDKNDRRSTTSNLTLLGGNALVNWVSRKQKTVALSSTEAETYGMTDAVKDLVFQENLVSEILGFQAPGPMIAYCDNTGAIFLATNNQVSQRTKHIDIRHRFISELVESGKLELRYIKTDENPADILSKNCKEEIHLKHADAIYDGFAASPIQEDVANHVSLVESRMTPKMTSIEDDDDWTEVQSKERKTNRRASYKCQEGQMLRVKALG